MLLCFIQARRWRDFSPLSMWWWKQASSDPAVKWAHFQSLEGLSFDIPNKGCSSLLTFTLSLCNSWVLSSRHSFMTVFSLSFLLKWKCNKRADWPQCQHRHNIPYVPRLPQNSLLLGHGEGGLPFQRVKAFSNTDLYLGHRKQHIGRNKKKRSCLVSVCDICLGEESAELIGNPIVETLTS